MTLTTSVPAPQQTFNTTKSLLTASDFVPKVSGIITSDGQNIPIHTHLLEVNVVENIISPCVTGTALLAEGDDLVTNFKFNGNEYIAFYFDKPGWRFPYKKAFRIYSITDRKMGASGKQEYLIHFCSEEMILSQLKFISKSYKGKRVSDMVIDIMNHQLKTDSTKFAYAEQTDGLFDYIIPKIQGFEAISWLTHRAYNSQSSAFFFFENIDGFNFTSYETLLKKYPVYQIYYLNPKITTAPGQNINSINYFEIEKDFDTIDTGSLGGYAASMMVYDFNAQTYNMVLKSAADNTAFPLMNQTILNNGASNRLNIPMPLAYDYFMKFQPVQDYRTTGNPQTPDKWLLQPYVRMAMLNSFKMKLVVPGDPQLTVGRLIEVVIPKGVVQFGSYNINELRTAKYLVTSVQHTFNFRANPIMTTNMSVVTDSISTTWSPPDFTNPGVQAIQGN